MKTKLILAAILSALAFPTSFAADGALSSGDFQERLKSTLSALATSAVVAGSDKSSTSAEERLIEADLSVVLEQYRKVRALQQEDELDSILGGEPTDPKDQIEQARRRDALARYAEKLAGSARDYGARLRKLLDSGSVKAGQ